MTVYLPEVLVEAFAGDVDATIEAAERTLKMLHHPQDMAP
jgi:hypothetical protein